MFFGKRRGVVFDVGLSDDKPHIADENVLIGVMPCVGRSENLERIAFGRRAPCGKRNAPNAVGDCAESVRIRKLCADHSTFLRAGTPKADRLVLLENHVIREHTGNGEIDGVWFGGTCRKA